MTLTATKLNETELSCKDGVDSLKVSYQVIDSTSADNADPLAVRNATGVSLYDAYGSTRLLARNFSVKQNKDCPYTYVVVVEYAHADGDSEKSRDGSGGGGSALPSEDYEMGWSVDFTYATRIADRNPEDGNLISNSLGEPLPDLPDQEISHPVLTLTQWEGDECQQKAITYDNSVNSGQWEGFAAGLCKMRIRADWDSKKDRWRVQYKIEVNPYGWRTYPIDKGWNCLAPGLTFVGSKIYAPEEKRRITDCYGNQMKEMSLLDGNGAVLSGEGATPVKFPAGGILLYPSLDWSPLNLVCLGNQLHL